MHSNTCEGMEEYRRRFCASLRHDGENCGNNIMAWLSDEDEDDDNEITEDFVQDDSNKQVQAEELKTGRLIGRGRSCIVYETTLRGKRYVRKDFLRVPRNVFKREAAVLAALDAHPNVTRTHCWSVNEGSCSLVTDLMHDDLHNVMCNRIEESAWRPSSDDTSHVIDLRSFIEGSKNPEPESRPVASTMVSSFSMSEALHLMLQIVEGVMFLHEHGVAHGDLKPRNILVTENERGGLSLKVTDFGLVSTKMKSKALVSQRARKLEIARWRAPELLDKSYLLREDDSDSDWDSDHDCGEIHTYGKLSRADVYSFAVTCAQILTGDDPYSGLGLRELVSKVSGPDGLRPRLPGRCPAQLSDLIYRCWGDELGRPTFINIHRELKVLQASLTSELMGYMSSSFESEGIFKMPRVPLTQRNPMEVADSSLDESIKYRPLSPVSVLGAGFPVTSYHEIIDNQLQKRREHNCAGPPVSWAPPDFTYTSSSIKNKVSRALKKCVPDYSNVPKRFHSRYVYHGSNEIPDYYFERQGPGIPVSRHYNYRHKRSDHMFSPETTTSENVWKKAFVRIPSKIQHWATNSVQLCKPNCMSYNEDFKYSGDQIL